ncbi:MAG: flagellar biosynthesis anti-sigma factor FlgM [Terracidiphilus sp.]|jgi:negative regulator of flagellin synthesis FlgM
MRIDLTQATASQIASEPNPKPVSAPQTTASDLSAGEDRTTLSSAQQSVSDLVSSAMSSPEIRQQKVDALSQAINAGKYELDPEQIAASMIDEHA